jgi:hypothetical protein
MDAERSCVTQLNLVAPTSGAMVGWVFFVAVTAMIGIIALPSAGRLYDFRAFYSAGYLVLHQPSRLFDLAAQVRIQDAIVCPMWRGVPFYHPAYEALLYAPFTLLSYRHAYMAYMAWNLVLLLGCYCLAPRTRAPELARVPRSALFLLAFPVFMCTVEGQNSILFLFVACLVWRALEKDRLALAGLVLGLALFKLPIVVVTGVLLSIRLGRRFLTGLLTGSAAVMLLSVAITGIEGTKQWLSLMVSASVASHLSHHAQAVSAVYAAAMPSLNGLLFASGGRLLRPAASLRIDAVASAAVFTVGIYLVRRASSASVALCAAICSALLLSPHLYLYDYTLILFPVLLLRGRSHVAITTAFYVLPYALFVWKGLDMFAFVAVIPLLFLASAVWEVVSRKEVAWNPTNASSSWA